MFNISLFVFKTQLTISVRFRRTTPQKTQQNLELGGTFLSLHSPFTAHLTSKRRVVFNKLLLLLKLLEKFSAASRVGSLPRQSIKVTVEEK